MLGFILIIGFIVYLLAWPSIFVIALIEGHRKKKRQMEYTKGYREIMKKYE